MTQTPTPSVTPRGGDVDEHGITHGGSAATLAGEPQATSSDNALWPVAIVVVLVVVAVQLMSYAFPPYIIPPVPDIVVSLGEVFAEYGSDMVDSIIRFVIAIVSAMFGGWIIGLLMSLQRTIGRLGEAFFRLVLATPALSIMVFAVLWFRGIELRIFFVAFTLAVPFYVIAVYEAVKGLDRGLVDAVQQFRPTRWQMLRLVLIPYTVSHLVLTTKSIASFTLRIIVFAEVIAATSGVGSAIVEAQANFRTDRIFAWTVILVAFSFVMLATVDRLERVLLKWRPENSIG